MLFALSISAPSFAGTACCPMSAATAPCHVNVMAGCHTGCGFCQVQAPLTRSPATVPVALPDGRRFLQIDISDQLLAPPAIPPPRGD
jgi:hypothetical protein